MSERSPDWMSGYQTGFVDGYFSEDEVAAPYVSILTDLIAGMRAAAEMNEGSAHSRFIVLACDTAEARLREVGGDE